MRPKNFFRFCFAVSFVLLGVIYTGLAALHACTNGACWPGIGPHFSFSVIATGLACTQIMPWVMLFLLMWGTGCPDHQTNQEEWKYRCIAVSGVVLAYLFLFPLTIGLSFGGLVSLRACASGKCYSSLSTPASLAMFLCGQITNFLMMLLLFSGFTLQAEESPEFQVVLDSWSGKRRRQVCNLDNAALPA